jgi:hypothetical protein
VPERGAHVGGFVRRRGLRGVSKMSGTSEQHRCGESKAEPVNRRIRAAIE